MRWMKKGEAENRAEMLPNIKTGSGSLLCNIFGTECLSKERAIHPSDTACHGIIVRTPIIKRHCQRSCHRYDKQNKQCQRAERELCNSLQWHCPNSSHVPFLLHKQKSIRCQETNLIFFSFLCKKKRRNVSAADAFSTPNSIIIIFSSII